MSTFDIYFIAGLTVLFTLSYSVGIHMNRRVLRRTWRRLSGAIRPLCGRRVGFRNFGSSGFKVWCRPKSKSLSKLEIGVFLLSREIILYYLYAKARGKRDRLVILSSLKERPRMKLDIVSRRMVDKVRVGRGAKLLKVKGLPSDLIAASTKPKEARDALRNPEVLGELRKILPIFRSLSLSMEEPHLELLCDLDENLLGEALKLVDALGEAVLTAPRGGRQHP